MSIPVLLFACLLSMFYAYCEATLCCFTCMLSRLEKGNWCKQVSEVLAVMYKPIFIFCSAMPCLSDSSHVASWSYALGHDVDTFKHWSRRNISVPSAAVCMANWQQWTMAEGKGLCCCYIMAGGNVTLICWCTRLNDLIRKWLMSQQSSWWTQPAFPLHGWASTLPFNVCRGKSILSVARIYTVPSMQSVSCQII
jgi:hypothetical protein